MLWYIFFVSLKIGSFDLLLDVSDGRLEGGFQALLLDLLSVMLLIKVLNLLVLNLLLLLLEHGLLLAKALLELLLLH